jgi:uncharacterized membrane protein
MATQQILDDNWPALPLGVSPMPSNNAEYITLLAHYYRGELARMAGWRTRIDLTSNWAITVAGAMLSISLSTPTAHHGVVLLAMLLITLLLTIEARRYRFFDVYRSRVRGLERHWYAQIFEPDPGENPEWLRQLAADLRRPTFHLTRLQALSRRLRRNYGWMYLVLLLAWLLKTSSNGSSPDGYSHLVSSFSQWVSQCQLAVLPGSIVVVLVAAFYGGLLFVALRYWLQDVSNKREYGEVYV